LDCMNHCLEGIKQRIEEMRDQMIELGDAYGLNDPQVLSASKELDDLIVQFHLNNIKQ
jgi:hypothetical protein